MEDQLILQLKKLRAVSPRPEWHAATRRAVLASREPAVEAAPILRAPRVSFATILWFTTPATVLAILALILIPSLVPSEGGVLSAQSALDPTHLTQELNDLSINVQIKEIRYQQNANSAVASAISEITDTKTKHLSPSLLEEETKALDLQVPHNTSIDDMLNTVIQ